MTSGDNGMDLFSAKAVLNNIGPAIIHDQDAIFVPVKITKYLAEGLWCVGTVS